MRKYVSIQPNKKPRKCVEIYLEEERLVMDENKINLLTWSNVESSKFSTMFKIARDMLAILISTVAFKSVAGLFLTLSKL